MSQARLVLLQKIRTQFVFAWLATQALLIHTQLAYVRTVQYNILIFHLNGHFLLLRIS